MGSAGRGALWLVLMGGVCCAAGGNGVAQVSRPWRVAAESRILRERALGQAMFAEYLRSSVPWVGEHVNEYVNRLGQNLARASQSENVFVFRVVHSSDLNAEAFPGGYVVVHSGTLRLTESEAELASVLAHEIAHVNARHWQRARKRQGLHNLLALASLFTGNVPLAVAMGLGTAAAEPMTSAGFSRAFEREADRLALDYLVRAGYDPSGMADLLGRENDWQRHRATRPPGLLADHPSAASRRRAVEAALAGGSLSYPLLTTTSEFESVRQEVRDCDQLGAEP